MTMAQKQEIKKHSDTEFNKILKYVNPTMKLIVFGYIRKQQKMFTSLHPNNIFYIISELITYLILMYYNRTEKISIYNQSVLQYDEINNILTNNTDKTGTAYGDVDVNFDIDGYMIYEWTIKLLMDKETMYIGFDSSQKKHLTRNFVLGGYGDYYCFASRTIFSRDYKTRENLKRDEWKTNDIIKIEVNTKTKAIRLKHNNEVYKNAFTNIDFKNKIFNLAITPCNKGESIQIENFTQNKII